MNNSKMRNFLKKPECRRIAIVLAIVLLLILPGKIFFSFYKDIMHHLPPCPSVFLFKVYCPGCGTTRALYCLFHGNIAGVFANNPILLFYLPVAAALYIKPELCRHYRCINVLVAILVIFMILRNLPWYPFTLLAPAGI